MFTFSRQQQSELGIAVDWWTEGVCLPIIAIIGICGKKSFIIPFPLGKIIIHTNIPQYCQYFHGDSALFMKTPLRHDDENIFL